MLGEGDGLLPAGPLKGVRAPLPMLKNDYYASMQWNPESGHLKRSRAVELGMADLLEGYTD